MTLDSKIRRRLWQAAAVLPFAPPLPRSVWAAQASPRARVRPGDPDWPSNAQWQQLNDQVSGRLVAVRSPLVDCRATPASAECAQLFKAIKNPYFIGDEVALTQTLGWVDAWTSSPSVYAVAARNTSDVVAAVDFARKHRLRLVVKGGGHSYQGTSNAPDSLLIWTRRMNAVALHEAFVAQGCAASSAPQRAVTVEAGAMWSQVYDAVTTKAGSYVQGGGCMTVGVAGLIQSGGFGSFSKRYGLASGSLLEAEVVTADGQVRIANACTNAELFWSLKGGGGGSFGVVTRVTLRVHALPENFGAVNLTIKAHSPTAFRRLIARVLAFYGEALMNPHWGEQIRFRADNTVAVSMVFQGLERSEARAVWQPFLDSLAAASEDFSVDAGMFAFVSVSAQEFWSPTLIKRTLGFIRSDDRQGAPKTNVFWPGDQNQAGQVLHGFESAWLSATLLQENRREALADALFAATRHWPLSLHFNKGLAGAPPEAIAAARDTAMNPAVLDAFALVILGAEEQPAYPGIEGHEPDVARARRRSQALDRAMGELRKLAPNPGAYVSESNYFEKDWQQAFWGSNYARLRAVKSQYDPEGLFFVHHGVGSEDWSDDGFTPR